MNRRGPRRGRTHWATRLLLVMGVLSVTSGSARSQIPEDEAPIIVELLGLRLRDASALRDSLAEALPNGNWFSCSRILAERGYPSVSVDYTRTEDGPLFTVTVVEPEFSDLITPWQVDGDSLHYHPGWGGAERLLQHENRVFQKDLRWYVRRGQPRVEGSLAGFLGRRRRDRDYELARSIVLRDANSRHRAIAMAILSSFAEREETWHLLLRGLLDDSVAVATTSAIALRELIDRFDGRPMDWQRSHRTVAGLLRGTNVSALPITMEVLGETLPPGGNGLRLSEDELFLVREYARATSPAFREPAIRLLQRLERSE